VFGTRSAPIEARRYRRFGLEVETDSERWVEEFDAYFDPDAGAILGVMNARTEVQQANATALLLRTSLRDDDGVPADWRFPAEPVRDDDGDEVLYVEEDGEVVEWQPEDGDESGEVPDGVAVRYEWHDGDLLTAAELRDAIREFDVFADGSSRRRFEWVMNSPRHRVQLDALNALSEWITGEVAKRPTRKPTSSHRGQQRTGRTSRGSSHGTR
jgi:hypothetical protein